ncbi:MAG: relaxase/mobilization nuclease domain-containing protein [Flavobacteriales bacterium]|nr:relaxase/mobilization nuclease domain-containing protein [Flavobacteriales bacterium]
MIAKIIKIDNFRHAVCYSEQKCEKGYGELIYSNTLGSNLQENLSAFTQTTDLNPNIRVNKGSHISISLAPGENISNEEFSDLCLEYLDKLGYSDCPFLIYRHYDTSNEHIHIITSNVDFAGLKVSDSFEKYRSKEISRQLEKEFGLKVTEYKGGKKETLDEINSEKYKYHNGLTKALSDPQLSVTLRSSLPSSTINKILDKPVSNEDISLMLDLNRDSTFRLLDQNNLVYKSKKSILLDKLDSIYAVSSTRQDFMAKVNDAGLYARILLNSKSNSIQYGDPNNDFYIKPKLMPQKFRYSNLEYLGTGKTMESAQRSIQEQRSFVYNNLIRSIRKSSSLDHLVNSLHTRGIRTDVHRNSRGVYGLSFTALNIQNPETFKATEIDRSLGWNQIASVLQFNLSKTPDVHASQTRETPPPKGGTENLSFTVPPVSKPFEEEEERKKKQKRKRGRGPSF